MPPGSALLIQETLRSGVDPEREGWRDKTGAEITGDYRSGLGMKRWVEAEEGSLMLVVIHVLVSSSWP